MSDNRPIGIFDSGLGGLTIAREIERMLPNESIIYLGDTARVPYGNRSPETIQQFSREIVHFLRQSNIKALVIACFSASSAASQILRQENTDLSILNVIAPHINLPINTPESSIGIIGTRATINSGVLANTIAAAYPKATIRTQPCPLFVPIIEEGITTGPLVDQTISLYLNDWQQQQPQYLILGCTHYPLLTHALEQYLPHTTIFQPGILMAQTLSQHLVSNQLEASAQNNPNYTYYVTDLNSTFQPLAEQFLQKQITIQKVTLT